MISCAQMREPRATGLHVRRDGERFFDIHVSRVGLVPQSIENEMRHSANLFDHADPVPICNRSRYAASFSPRRENKIAEDRRPPMVHGQRRQQRVRQGETAR